MSEEQFKIEKEFLESLTIHTSQDLKMDFDIRTDGKLDDIYNLLSKFKDYLIEHENKTHEFTVLMLHKKIEVLESEKKNIIDQIRSITNSVGIESDDEED